MKVGAEFPHPQITDKQPVDLYEAGQRDERARIVEIIRSRAVREATHAQSPYSVARQYTALEIGKIADDIEKGVRE